MLDTEREITSKHGNEQSVILEEYADIVENLKRELHICKIEQNNIRCELETLRSESRNANDVREAFNNIHLEQCGKEGTRQNEVENLQERIALLESEKESVQQLWHISLNTIDVLEEELRGFRVNGKNTKFYQEQANNVKETYSEAIKALEGKLFQAKENFLRQQALCQSSKEKIDVLTKDKNELAQKLQELQMETEEKDRNNWMAIETLKKELSLARTEIERLMNAKLDLEKKLCDTKVFAENMMERDKETKLKMAEAIELIESAVREKDLALHREALTVEEKTRLEQRLTTIANEYDAKIQELNMKLKDEYERAEKRYSSELKELKVELKEKVVQLEQTQKELLLTEEELQRVRKSSDDALANLNAKLLDQDQRAKSMEVQLLEQEKRNEAKHDAEMKQLKYTITTLEEKLISSNEKLWRLEHQTTTDIEDRVKEVDRRRKDILDQYANLEHQLARSLGDREDLVVQLKSLKHEFQREIQKRDNERFSLESKIQELEKTSYVKDKKSRNCSDCPDECFCPHDFNNKRTLDIKVENKCHCCQTVLSDHMNKLQEKFDKKTKELMHHVQLHQKLSKRWKDEAKSITAKFQGKTKELKGKINALQKENKELGTELLLCKQQLAQQMIQDINRFKETNEIR